MSAVSIAMSIAMSLLISLSLAMIPLGAPRAQAILAGVSAAAAPAQSSLDRQVSGAVLASRPQVRGTWLTTTANDALATPYNTALTMRQLREIGLNTVYIEAWKNGYTQFPSQVLGRAIGVTQRPTGLEQDPADSAHARSQPARDLLHEAVTEAHRQGLVAIAWFEYGFMAAHQSTMNHLRRLKPEWLSRNLQGQEVAPNGFVWLNPLHPKARELLLDLVLEAIDRYDLDGVQLDDRIVWPHVTMGYDDYTRAVYASEHQGAQPPSDHTDLAWMRWRAAKVDEYARWFVQEVRARRPGLVISLSPAVYPWSWDNYLLDWPRWAAWSEADRLKGEPVRSEPARRVVPQWDEIVPQAYRMSFPAFEAAWREQIAAVQARNAYRSVALVAGIRIVGDGPDSSWDQLRRSLELVELVELVDAGGQGGHVLWFSRGVLQRYPQELKAWYAQQGPAHSPRFAQGWRPVPWVLQPESKADSSTLPTPNCQAGCPAVTWSVAHLPAGRYVVIGKRPSAAESTGGGQPWRQIQTHDQASNGPMSVALSEPLVAVELLLDRREDMRVPLRSNAP